MPLEVCFIDIYVLVPVVCIVDDVLFELAD
jgi:hypothetical protein